MMEKNEYKCPDCKNKLNDVRDQDDRIDFWCITCNKAYNIWFYTNGDGDKNESDMQTSRS